MLPVFSPSPPPFSILSTLCSVTALSLHSISFTTSPPSPCRKKGKFIELVQQHSFDWDSKAHRELLKSMLMTACDVAAITKPWDIQKEVCVLCSVVLCVHANAFVCVHGWVGVY